MQWLKDFAANAQANIKSNWGQFNNATFKNAAMATCALVSAADGSVSKDERTKVAKLIGSCEYLKDFNAKELGDLFTGFCDKAGDEFARLDLLRMVGKLKGNEAQADMSLKVALIIAGADGNFDADEKKVVTELCGVLGVATTDYLS